MVKLSRKLNLNQYVLSPMYVIASARFGFGVVRILPLQDWVLEGAKHFFSLHFVRRYTLHLSKTVSGFFRRYNYSILDNKTTFFHYLFFT